MEIAESTRPAAWNVLTGTLVKYVLLAVNIALGVFMMPFTIHHLGKAEYGLWMIVASMTAYFQLLDLGYGGGLVRHITDADARRDTGRVNEIVSTFACVYAAIGAMAFAGVLMLAWAVVPRFPGIPAEHVRTAQLVLLILGLRVAVGFPMTVFGAVTTARQYFALNGLIALAVTLAQAAITYLVLSSGGRLVALVASTTAVTIASYVAYAASARRACPSLQIRPSAFRPGHVRQVTQFSLYLFIVDVAILIGFNLDHLVVGAFLGTSAVAVYAVTLRLAEYQRLLCNQANGLLFPLVVRFEARGDADALRHTMIEGTRLAFALVAGTTICLTAFAPQLIRAWIGEGFSESVAPLYVLAATGVVLVSQGPLGNVLLATGRHRLVAFACLAEAVANLVLSVILVRRFGLLGVALGTAIPVFVANLGLLLPAACRRVGLPVHAFLRAALTPGLAAAGPAGAIAGALRLAIASPSLGMVSLEIVAVSAVYLLSLALVGLSSSERTRYFGYARRMVPALARARVVTT